VEKQVLPKIIYHYTTQDGLLGILNDSSLWATKIQYLNDASELAEPLRIADAILTKLERQFEAKGVKGRQLEEDIIRRVHGDIGEWEQINICIVSFCTDGDLLSQWRGYGVPGSAYSIGFDREKLVKTMDSYPFELHQCKYFNPAVYCQQITKFVSEVIEEARVNSEMPEDFIGKFLKMAATMKLNCFEEEHEWRIVSRQPLSFTDERFKFRPSKSTIIPYYALPFDLSSIVEIIIGPCQHPELAHSTVCGLAHKFNLEKVQRGQVKMSRIPYRQF
jgi:hypothetical protein